MTLRIGLLAPAANPTLAADLQAAFTGRAVVDFEPLARPEPVTPDGELKMLNAVGPAAKSLGARRPDVVVLGCASATALLGLDGEQDLCDDLRDATDATVIGANHALLSSLKRSGIKRPVLLTPYEWPLTLTLRGELLKHHIDVALTACLELAGTSDVAAVSPEQICDFAVTHADAGCDGLVLAGCALRSRAALPSIRERTSLPAISANSALVEEIELWLAKREGAHV